MKKISFFILFISFLVGIDLNIKENKKLTSQNFKQLSFLIKDLTYQGYFCQLSNETNCPGFNQTLNNIVLESNFISENIKETICDKNFKEQLNSLFFEINYVFISMKFLNEMKNVKSNFLDEKLTDEFLILSDYLIGVDPNKCFIEKE